MIKLAWAANLPPGYDIIKRSIFCILVGNLAGAFIPIFGVADSPLESNINMGAVVYWAASPELGKYSRTSLCKDDSCGKATTEDERGTGDGNTIGYRKWESDSGMGK